MDEQKPIWKVVLWIIGLWWLAHIVLVAGHVFHIFLYSISVAPGLENADYQAYARVSAPWFSIIFGGPVFYTIGRILKKRLQSNGRRSGLAVWGLYTLTDAAILTISIWPVPALLVGQWIVSQAVKLAAVLLGTRDADQRMD